MRRARHRLSAAVAAAVILSSASCSRESDTLEPEYRFGGTVLTRHQAASDGQPAAFGPYAKRGDLDIQAACLGGGKIDVKVYADQFTPNIFTDRHAGAIAYLTKDCDGTVGFLGLDANVEGSQHCIVANFVGDVTTYRVTVNGVAGPELTSPQAAPANATGATPHVFPCRTGA
ncbi:hypothetical protein [Catellatospora paridis]|uniref:hypothetical protein n=1 Tax=Catellatospora paridis TaxID=1617086 RepID=UPI0012D4770A|nr:hypothetical protein [Catellatospora paridis]